MGARYRLDVQDRHTHLEIEAHGVLDAESDRRIDVDIVRLCREHGRSRAVVDIRPMRGRLSVIENYDAAISFRERLGDVVERLAIVDEGDAATHARNRFYEDAAVNRGAVVRFFDDVSAAARWLAEG